MSQYYQLFTTSHHLLPTSLTNFFFHLLTCINSTILLDVLLQALNFFFISFFTCLALSVTITPSFKSNMNNSFRVFFNEFLIIKINIIKVYSIKSHIVSKNMALSESSLNKTTSTLEDTTSLRISCISFVKNQLGTVFNAGSKAFLEFCFDQEQNQTKKDKY